MQKLCCFPCNETPNVNVEMKCISTCCASKLANNSCQRPNHKQGSTDIPNENDKQKSCTKSSC